jgi:hypothetical protein
VAAAKESLVTEPQGTYGWMSTMYPSTIGLFSGQFIPAPAPEPEAGENTTLEGGTTAPTGDGDVGAHFCSRIPF